jgi:hypothetical protein
LSHESHPESQIKVTIRPLRPKIVMRAKDYIEVEGGVVFYLNIGSAFIAGKYAGTLTITQNHF